MWSRARNFFIFIGVSSVRFIRIYYYLHSWNVRAVRNVAINRERLGIRPGNAAQ